jgi:hypothetical protein
LGNPDETISAKFDRSIGEALDADALERQCILTGHDTTLYPLVYRAAQLEQEFEKDMDLNFFSRPTRLGGSPWSKKLGTLDAEIWAALSTSPVTEVKSQLETIVVSPAAFLLPTGVSLSQYELWWSWLAWQRPRQKLQQR